MRQATQSKVLELCYWPGKFNRKALDVPFVPSMPVYSGDESARRDSVRRLWARNSCWGGAKTFGLARAQAITRGSS